MASIQADERFLRRILFVLIIGTAASGLMAGLATVKAGSASPNVVLFDTDAR